MASNTTWRNYANAGGGVHFPHGRPTSAEMHRIEMLGKLNDRRRQYLSSRNRKGLFSLAAEYHSKGMPRMAESIKAEAKGL